MASVSGSTPLWLVSWECYPQRRNQTGRTTLGHLSMPTTVPRIQLQGSAPITWCVEATLLPCGCYLTLRYGTYHLKFVQKMWEHVKWAHKKAETFQAKEAQHHKLNYDKRSKAAALEVGDMVLIHVIAFKAHHKIQNWWENREYLVKRWPYPNVLVYVVCPRDGEWCSWTLHRNYLLPISPNLKQNEKDTPMAGVALTSTSAPAPCVDSESADAEPSGTATPDTTGNISLGSLDQPAPLRCGTCTTQNQLPWRYWNFALLADNSPPGIWDACIGLFICLHFISCLYTVFVGCIVWTHFTCSISCLLGTTHFSIEGNSINIVSGGILDGGNRPKIIWSEHSCPTREKIQESNPHRDFGSV